MAGSAFWSVSISAYYLPRRRHYDFAKASLKVGLGFGMIATILQMISGDISAKGVVKNQPVKFAALEGLYDTEASAPADCDRLGRSSRPRRPSASRFPARSAFWPGPIRRSPCRD